MKKRWMRVMALMLAFSVVAIGCASGSAESKEAQKSEEKSEEPVKLKALLMSEDEARVRVYNEYYEPNIKKDLPDLDVEFELPGKGYQEKLRIYNASGELPDVFFGWHIILESGNAVDLTPYLEEDGFMDKYKTSSALIPYSDGNIYAISAGTDAYYTSAMIYNKDVFEKENLQVPTNFDELLKVSEEFSSKGYTPISLFGSFTGYAFLPQDLITMDNPDGMKQIISGEAGFGSDAFKKGMDKYEQLIQANAFAKDAATTTYDEHVALFTSGKAPMLYAPLWVCSALQDMQNIDYFCLSSFDKSPEFLNGWGQAYGGYMVSKNSENIEEAVKLAEWMVEQDAEFFSKEMGNAVGIETGTEPQLTPITQEFYDLFNQEDMEVIPNYASNYLQDSVKAEMEVNIGKFLTRQLTADEFCSTMEDIQKKAEK
ncbi:MAG: extracellular solute-binding protein [Muricomes sp.]|uniref:ABC transporter substrate-binding protein n=1 Tax=Faecalicatena contorta TaxID=39482 RepID=UPI002EC1A404|nr:extracellular solute-binding protein [Muricomes sp.]